MAKVFLFLSFAAIAPIAFGWIKMSSRMFTLLGFCGRHKITIRYSLLIAGFIGVASRPFYMHPKAVT